MEDNRGESTPLQPSSSSSSSASSKMSSGLELGGQLFRSEPMSRCQLILPQEASYACVAELGELGLVQFVDLNEGVSSFQRKFVAEVKRCEEMERTLRFLEQQAMREAVQIRQEDAMIMAPPPREMSSLESTLTKMESDLAEVNTNFVALRKNQAELIELKSMLIKTEGLLEETHFQIGDAHTNAESTDVDDSQLVEFRGLDSNELRGLRFQMTAGVLESSKRLSFERLLWRVSKGNVFVRFCDEMQHEDAATGHIVRKSVFVVFYQGEQLRNRVNKICEGYHATIYPCPEKASERREMLNGVNTRLADLQVVLKETEDHRLRLIRAGANNLRTWYTKVRKIKAIHHCLNMFSVSVSEKALVAECWLPQNDMVQIQKALRRGCEDSGTNVSAILNTMNTTESPPTFNRVNKYTSGFQNLIDTYGVNTYREVNPAVYTVATFPFLFAVMFGDFGHGVIIFLAALTLIILEKRLAPMSTQNEIFHMFFGGRYIIVLMGLFSMYTGLIYNDTFSKMANLFGSGWYYRDKIVFPLNLEDTIMLDPGNFTQYEGTPYFFGVDPVWQSATNKIQFLNTYKMKISIIFGITHMSFGLGLSLWNKLIKKDVVAILLEFVPQVLFLSCLFVYLCFLVFFKWIVYHADTANAADNVYSEHCAPNLLITFINMMLFKEDTPDPALRAICKGYEVYMFVGQKYLQYFLIVCAFISVPVLLFGQPAHILIGRKYRRRHYENLGGDEDDLLEQGGSASGHHSEHDDQPFGELMIYQGIHTIEYVLNCISHTASYLRLWALSLAHAQLSEVLWQMVMQTVLTGFGNSLTGAFIMFFAFAFWAILTISILVIMEGLSAFLHTLRLHWVEFQTKFYDGQGRLFSPFKFESFLKEAAQEDQEVIKSN